MIWLHCTFCLGFCNYTAYSREVYSQDPRCLLISIIMVFYRTTQCSHAQRKYTLDLFPVFFLSQNPLQICLYLPNCHRDCANTARISQCALDILRFVCLFVQSFIQSFDYLIYTLLFSFNEDPKQLKLLSSYFILFITYFF